VTAVVQRLPRHGRDARAGVDRLRFQ
jgi:hypothetical protein